MAEEPKLMTVFRSGDSSAEEDADSIRGLLGAEGIAAEIFGDDTPGVLEGTCEVRVPAPVASRAEEIIAASQNVRPQPGEPSEALDLVPLFTSDLPSAEMEATSIRAVLDANNIPCVIVSSAPYPSLPFEVRVPKSMLEAALLAIAEARSAGPAAAEEAERAGEEGA